VHSKAKHFGRRVLVVVEVVEVIVVVVIVAVIVDNGVDAKEFAMEPIKLRG
jgi:hypothetical protein